MKPHHRSSGFAIAVMAGLLSLVPMGCTQSVATGASNPAVSSLQTPAESDVTAFTWKGYTWMAATGNHGPGPNNWSASNATIDANGYLHLKITNVGGVWYCPTIYTTQALGFGTYQWVVTSPINNLDPNVVFGMFHYDGIDYVNEIDVEYTVWQVPGNNNGWFTVYPNSTFPSPNESDYTQSSFKFTNSGTTTTRYTWGSTGVDYYTMSGVQPVGTVANVLGSWSYHPSNSANLIPQSPMPLYMDLWLRQGAAPTNGQTVDITITDFSFTPANSGSNLLTNPGFENSLTGWTNWGGMTAVTTSPHSGSKCCQISLADGGGCQQFAVGGRTRVTMSGWARASVAGGNAVFGVDFLNSSGTKISQTIVLTATTTTWTNGSKTIAVPSGTATIRPWIYHNPGSGSAFFDDLSLQ